MKILSMFAKRPVTVSSIVIDFKQKIDQLNALHQERQELIRTNKETVSQLLTANNNHESEAKLALTVADKLKTLVG